MQVTGLDAMCRMVQDGLGVVLDGEHAVDHRAARGDGDILQAVYRTGPGLAPGSRIPDDPELPLPLNQVHPVHEVVRIDYFLPGCPPSGDAIWSFLNDLIAGRDPRLGHDLLHYD